MYAREEILDNPCKFGKNYLSLRHVTKNLWIMRRLLTALFFLFVTAVSAGSGDTYVYICTGPQSKRYHRTSTCKGLKSCSKEVVKVTLEKARNMNRTPCGYCYKR